MRKLIVPFLCIGLSILLVTAAIRNRYLASLVTGAGFPMLALNLAFPPRPADFGRYFQAMRDLIWFETGLGACMLLVGGYVLLVEYRTKRFQRFASDAPRAGGVRMWTFVAAMAVLGLLPVFVGVLARGGHVMLPERVKAILLPLAFLFVVIDAPIFYGLRLRQSRLLWFLIAGAAAPVVAAAPFIYSLPTMSAEALSGATEKMKYFASIVGPYGALMGLACGLLSRVIPRTRT